MSKFGDMHRDHLDPDNVTKVTKYNTTQENKMNIITKLENITEDLRDIRDDHPCDSEDDGCLCAMFDHAIDKVELVLAEVIKAELKYIEHVQLPELEGAEDKHERDATTSDMARLEARLGQLTSHNKGNRTQ